MKCSIPEQNTTFQDHYLDVDYDLSQVLFVATANVMHTIPAALQDRMEVLRLQGYTEQEKLEIARQYLVKKQREQTGLSEKNIVFKDDAILEIIRYYTREAGVRNLEREIGNVCRKVARKVVKTGAKHKEEITAPNITSFWAWPSSATPRCTRRVKSAWSPASRGPKSAAAFSPPKCRCSTARASSPSPASSAM